jgi:hypothetical protein
MPEKQLQQKGITSSTKILKGNGVAQAVKTTRAVYASTFLQPIKPAHQALY